MKILSASAFVVLFDQITKYWIKSNYMVNTSQPVLGDFLKITFVENPGMAFGIHVGEYLPLITILSVFAIGLVIYYMYQERHKRLILRLGLALILGGAVGNMIDRILMMVTPEKHAGVVDFIDVGFRHYRWYIFNVADSSVTVGITLILIYSFFIKEHEENLS